jgi:hypothetical protein
MTEWRLIEQNPKYEVSADGHVRNRKTGRILKSTYGRYPMVCLGYETRVLVHRLVAKAFCERQEGANQVNHKNGDRRDNRAANLEWVTASQNNLHSRRVLMQCRGENHGLSRLDWFRVNEIRVGFRAGESVKKLANEFGVSGTTIRSIVAGRTWTLDRLTVDEWDAKRRKRERERA